MKTPPRKVTQRGYKLKRSSPGESKKMIPVCTVYADHHSRRIRRTETVEAVGALGLTRLRGTGHVPLDECYSPGGVSYNATQTQQIS